MLEGRDRYSIQYVLATSDSPDRAKDLALDELATRPYLDRVYDREFERRRVVIFKIDDGTEAIEAVAPDEIFAERRDLMAEDQLLVVQGKLQPDRFSGGLRLNVSAVWDLAAARARFGRYLSVLVNGTPPPVADVLRLWPARRVEGEDGPVTQGLALRLRLQRSDAVAEIDLGDDARFWPCDEAMGRWRNIAQGGSAGIVYE